ncbi:MULTISPECIES: bacterioferritin-associated ferredoxin [unclassified Duganella]|uniref:(2Fe-2S)-binding protein n=1 Tax=unclassified Duganella TaxID=2636909 RepID=UPI00087469DE|nr:MULTISPECIES: (2Fe-2S)-binding protein [unclassified Duganella]OEZ62217.1 bacterioferritin-associated ferredoxin [Duganella sp. HH105]OEZ99782.1 bacterioferritin-associated ferredoxin [Duganella sp. HH101]
MIVCVCNNISDREIRQAMELGLTSMEELRRDLGVATCCGQCFSCAEEILNEHLAASAGIQETVLKRPAFSN